MKSIPILFSTDMVIANLEGRKNQTRRLSGLEKINLSPNDWYLDMITHKHNIAVKDLFTGKYNFNFCKSNSTISQHIFPRIEPGDIIWVRETHYALGYKRYTGSKTKTGKLKTEFVDVTTDFGQTYKYEGDTLPKLCTYHELETWPAYTDPVSDMDVRWIKRPGLFMPHHAARMFAQCTGVRCERLQNISEHDCIDEGIECWDSPVHKGKTSYQDYLEPGKKDIDCPYINPITSYMSLWTSINGKESWNINPWVLTYDYKLITKDEYYEQLEQCDKNKNL